LSQFASGQNRKLTDEEINNSTVTKIAFVDTSKCDQINELFKKDLGNKTIFLFLQGGIAPIVYTADEEFEYKYGIYFHDFGCVSPDYKCIIEYSISVFDYLTKTYGNKWKREIRKDVIELKEWNRKKNGL
jgi:hypothetical protein